VRDTFKAFDKREKGLLSMQDIKSVLLNYLEIPVAEQDIHEMFR
jgi:hypothetical protein